MSTRTAFWLASLMITTGVALLALAALPGGVFEWEISAAVAQRVRAVSLTLLVVVGAGCLASLGAEAIVRGAVWVWNRLFDKESRTVL